MSYPKRADLFKKWTEAMLRGATVDKPSYSKSRQGKKSSGPRAGTLPRRKRRQKRRIRRKKED